jgi:hypothetical protein
MEGSGSVEVVGIAADGAIGGRVAALGLIAPGGAKFGGDAD